MPQGKVSFGNIQSRITRDQGPEFEQTLAFTATTQVSTPTSLRTDRKIKWFYLHVRGRITIGGSNVTFRSGPSILGTPLFALIQQFDYRGQHLRYGAQQPVTTRGEAMAEWIALMNPNYVPRFSVSVNGGALTPGASLNGTGTDTNDFEFILPIPTFPLDISPNEQPFYCIHGPDWPGNLYMDVLCADATALGVTTGSVTFSAYNSTSGSPSIDILTVRPLLGKTLASQIRPAVCFRVLNFAQPTTAVSSGAGGNGILLANLVVGKDTTRIFVKVGTSLANTSSGVSVFGTLSDTILTRTFFTLDNRNLRFQGPNGDSVMQDYAGLMYGREIPAGYRFIDFISGAGPISANPRAVFQSSQLTAARQYQLNGDVSGVASTQIAEENQEMLLGRPAMLQAASTCCSCSSPATASCC